MSAAAYLSIEKSKSEQNVLVRARHNLREFASGQRFSASIDPNRSSLNTVLRGPGRASEVLQQVQSLLAGCKRTVRHDAVRVLEMLIAIPANQLSDESAFFDACLSWVERTFSLPIVLATIHRDEAHPHLHILIVPVRDGRLVGSDTVGNRNKLAALQQNFFLQVARHFGLIAPTGGSRVSHDQRQALAQAVVQRLRIDPTPIQRAEVGAALQQLISKDPEALAGLLGIVTSARPLRRSRFVEIMPRPVKPEPFPIVRRSTAPRRNLAGRQ